MRNAYQNMIVEVLWNVVAWSTTRRFENDTKTDYDEIR
jgi:hypothetical protein